MLTARQISTKKQVFFSICIWSLIIVSGELGYRVYGKLTTKPPPEKALYVKDATLGVTHRKNASVIVDWRNTAPHKVSFNRFGFRGPNPQVIDKPKGIIRILTLGGSSTEEPYVADGKTWPEALQRRLNDLLGEERVEVINLGVAGYTTSTSTRNLVINGLQLDPDIVIVYHANNDFFKFVTQHEGVKIHHSFVDYERREPMLLERVLCRSSLCDAVMRFIYYSGNKSRDYTIACWRSPVKARIDLTGVEGPTIAALDRLSALANGRRFTLVVGIQATLIKEDLGAGEVPLMWEVLRYHYVNQCISTRDLVGGLGTIKLAQRRWAKESGVLCLDIESNVPKTREYFIDHIHSTERGSDRIGAIFAEGLLQSGLIKRNSGD
jgi:GDSL-like Lipase/Acylhydrolase family